MAYWDKEVEIGEIPKNKIEKQKISKTELKGKKYISITNLKLVNDEWRPVGGTSLVITDELKSLWTNLTVSVFDKEPVDEIVEKI